MLGAVERAIVAQLPAFASFHTPSGAASSENANKSLGTIKIYLHHEMPPYSGDNLPLMI
jgi:hypothetical protein